MNRICTIIALNYLPQAMALLESTRKVYPEVDFYVLIIDGTSKEITHLPTAHILLTEDLAIPSEWLLEMRSYYDAMELATSLKPFLLDTLLTDEIETVTYLDPDVLLFGELTEGIEIAKNHGIALTPHRLTPSNILKPTFSELEFLKYGVFNLGYIAVGQSSKDMLAWWSSRLRWYCTKFPNDPSFTDQKWMNFVPALFDFETVKNKGYNVAFWNLDERPLSLIDDTYFVGAESLIFIHFAQMSSVLAKGGKIDRWADSLDLSDESIISLRLISEITENYSKQLTDFGKSNKFENNFAMLNQKLSYHFKKRLIGKSIIAERHMKSVPQKSQNKTRKFGRISLFLEKSSAINGFRDGFAYDRDKFRKVFSRIFKR